MKQPKPPKIEFPCAYPIKTIGRAREEFYPTVLSIFERHASGFNPEDIKTKSSRAGKFISITVVIEATGCDQLSSLHEDLMATGLVSMVI